MTYIHTNPLFDLHLNFCLRVVVLCGPPRPFEAASRCLFPLLAPFQVVDVSTYSRLDQEKWVAIEIDRLGICWEVSGSYSKLTIENQNLTSTARTAIAALGPDCTVLLH